MRISDGSSDVCSSDLVVGFDTAKLQVEYPQNIKLYGMSFNTTLGDWSLQGELAYRPDAPMQVDLEDLAFAAFGPTLTRSEERRVGKECVSKCSYRWAP